MSVSCGIRASGVAGVDATSEIAGCLRQSPVDSQRNFIQKQIDVKGQLPAGTSAARFGSDTRQSARPS